MAVFLFSEVNSDASFQMRKPATKEGDTPEGSLENTRGIQDGFIDAASVLKEKIIKGKPLLSKWQITCRFPGPGYKGNHPSGSWMHVVLKALYVGLSSLPTVFSLQHLFCPTANVTSVSAYLKFPLGATLQALPSSSPVCSLNFISNHYCHLDTVTATGKLSQLLYSLYEDRVFGC
jgi:hypothetical protein